MGWHMNIMNDHIPSKIDIFIYELVPYIILHTDGDDWYEQY